MLQTLFTDNLSCPAIWIGERSITYKVLLEEIDSLTLNFREMGIQSGHRVAFIADLDLSSIVTFFALLKLGASPCLLSTRIPIEQTDFYLKEARISFFIDRKGHLEKRVEGKVLNESEILLFTSGSSGFPKLVSLKVSHFLESAKGSIERLDLSSQSCYLLTVPLFHVSGLSVLFRALKSGCSIEISSNLLDGNERASHVSMVPTQLLRVLERSSSFPKLKCLLLGGAQISENLVQLALKRDLPLYLTYGMTEMASQITVTSLGDSLIPIHLGKPLPNKQIDFSPEGEILVKGSSLFTGYDSFSGIERPFEEGGWFATGDLGTLDEKGNLIYSGRKDNLFISGGENIYPEFIEKALGKVPGILQSLVIPIEDREFGHRPVAFIQVENAMPSKEKIYDHVSAFIPKFCLPIHFFPFPPKLESMSFKHRRGELKKWLKDNFVK